MTCDIIVRHYSANVSRTIGTIHLLLGSMALAVYGVAFLLSGTLPFFSVGSVTVGLFLLSGFCQRQMRVSAQRTVWIFAAIDILLFMVIIWSFSALYGDMAAAALKSPSFSFIFGLIALQALRQSPALILFIGGVAIGARLVMFANTVSAGTDITMSYTWFQRSPAIMYSGEIELLLALILFVIFLAEVVKSSNRRYDAARVQSVSPDEISGRNEPVVEASRASISDETQAVESEKSLSFKSELERSPPKSDSKPANNIGSLRILIAEDSQVNMIVLERFLSSPSFELHMAEDGQAAITLFEKLVDRGVAPDVVLLDIEMPYMTGHEVARAIREFEQTNGMPPRPIIAVTALSDDQSIRESRNAGMNDHLVKPLKKELLLTAISRSLALSARDSR